MSLSIRTQSFLSFATRGPISGIFVLFLGPCVDANRSNVALVVGKWIRLWIMPSVQPYFIYSSRIRALGYVCIYGTIIKLSVNRKSKELSLGL